jgi:hypothetical protein
MVIFLQIPNILNRWKNYFTLLLNVHSFSDVRQIEIHTVKKAGETVAIIIGRHCYQLHSNILSIIFLSRLSPYIDEIIVIISVGFDVAD